MTLQSTSFCILINECCSILEGPLSKSFAPSVEDSHVHSDHLLLAVALASDNRRGSERTWLSSTDRENKRDITVSGRAG